MKNKLMELITKCAAVNDLDEAVLPIQDALGVDSGDCAAYFFSGVDQISNGKLVNTWEAMSIDDRAAQLALYVRYESRDLFCDEWEEDCDRQSTLEMTEHMKPDVDIYIRHCKGFKLATKTWKGAIPAHYEATSYLIHEWSDKDEASTLLGSYDDLDEAKWWAVHHAFSDTPLTASATLKLKPLK